MITAKELKKKTKDFQRQRKKELEKELKQFFKDSEKKLLLASAKGETRTILRLPFDFLDMGTEKLMNEVLNYYSYYGYKVTFVERNTRLVVISWYG